MSPESFIPIYRADIVRACRETLQQSGSDPEPFARFADILQAYIHHQYHERLETLKHHFACWDPDRDTRPLFVTDSAERLEAEESLSAAFVDILEQANYRPLTREQLNEAFSESSVLSLDMSIDFNDFARWMVYWRGEDQIPAPEPVSRLKRLWYRWTQKTPPPVDVFQRMVLLLRFKDADYFKERDLEQLPFEPGKMYLYLYKSIPRQDLEVLFPNVEIRMSWKDRLMFILPALGAAVPMLLKALPQLLLLLGVILFFTLGPDSIQRLGLKGQQVEQFLPILLALLSLGIMFGGFAFKQYLNYKNKRLKFLKDVTDTLFFKNLVCNAGVFHSLVDAAEEEASKEMLLVIFMLLQHPEGLDTDTLDQYIEQWLGTYDVTVDFDVHKALKALENIQNEAGTALVYSKNQRWHAQSLSTCCTILDQIWDNLYAYNEPHKPPQSLSLES